MSKIIFKIREKKYLSGVLNQSLTIHLLFNETFNFFCVYLSFYADIKHFKTSRRKIQF